MCGRYTLSTDAQVLADLFRLEEALALAPRYNIAPGQEIVAVRLDPESGRRAAASLRWGLVPGWAKDPSIASRTINARAEAAAEKPAFRAAFRERRCLIPADGFYEWKAGGARKQPHHIRLADGRPFAFAGLWERWRGPEGAALESCTILTTEPNALLRPIHDRMPVILPPEGHARWLDPRVREPEALRSLLAPYTAAEMVAYPVSFRVNSVAHDDAACIEPIADLPRSLFDD